MIKQWAGVCILLGAFGGSTPAEPYPDMAQAGPRSHGLETMLVDERPSVLRVGSNDDYYRKQDEQKRLNNEYYREQDRQKQMDDDYASRQNKFNDERYKSLQDKPKTHSESTSDEPSVREHSFVMDAVYWKYDNKLSPDGRLFNEFDHWLEFHRDGTFRETVSVKWAPTGNAYGGETSRGHKVVRNATGKYTIVEDKPEFLGELVYDDDPAMPVRFFMPRKFARFWPPEGFNLSVDPQLENRNEMNWKRTRGVGVRPPQWENF